MKILVIGSEGFIGKNCCSFFQKHGNLVWRADVKEQKEEKYFQLKAFETDFENIFKNDSFDVCINASGAAEVNFSFENPAKDFELNVWNVIKLLNALRLYNPKCKFINFSSAAVYGNPLHLPIHEKMIPKPLSPYGFHKLQSEYLLHEYHKFFNIPTCSMRVFSAYGPGLKKQLFWDLLKKINQNQTIELFGTGEESRDFIFIEDILIALDLIIKKSNFEGDIINVATGVEINIKEAVSTFYKIINPEIKFSFTGKIKLGDPNNWQADISKLKEFGFIPLYTLSEGLEKYVEWLKESELL